MISIIISRVHISLASCISSISSNGLFDLFIEDLKEICLARAVLFLVCHRNLATLLLFDSFPTYFSLWYQSSRTFLTLVIQSIQSNQNFRQLDLHTMIESSRLTPFKSSKCPIFPVGSVASFASIFIGNQSLFPPPPPSPPLSLSLSLSFEWNKSWANFDGRYCTFWFP